MGRRRFGAFSQVRARSPSSPPVFLRTPQWRRIVRLMIPRLTMILEITLEPLLRSSTKGSYENVLWGLKLPHAWGTRASLGPRGLSCHTLCHGVHTAGPSGKGRAG